MTQAPGKSILLAATSKNRETEKKSSETCPGNPKIRDFSGNWQIRKTLWYNGFCRYDNKKLRAVLEK